MPLIAVVALGAGAGQLGALRAAQQAPVLLLSLFVGVLVDRWRIRQVMIFADLGRAVVLAVIPITYLLGGLGVPVLFIVACSVGVFTVFFDVAYHAALVRLVDRDQLAQGNSMLESSTSAAQIGGPTLGGGLVALLSAPIAVVASVFFFALSCLSIRRIHRTESVTLHAERPVGMLRQIRDGLQLVARDVSLRSIGLASGAYQLFFAALMTSYLLFLPRTLGLSGAALGLALGALGPGSLIGSLLSARLPRRFGYGVVVVSAAFIADLVMLCVPVLHGSGAATIALLVVINFLFGICAQLVNVAVMAVRQAITPTEMQGRVAATLHFTGMGLAPIGSLLGGLSASQLGLRPTLVLTACGLLLSPLCLLLSPLARLGKTLPTPNPRRQR
jgi:predicted MFS family arabinose efflux permease